MSTDLTLSANQLPATEELMEDFMSAGGGERVFPSKFEVKLGNTYFAIDSTPDSPKVHPEFKKLMLKGNENDPTAPDGFSNYSRIVDTKETEFLVLQWSNWAEGRYNKVENKFETVSEEVKGEEPFVVKDSLTGEIVYKGPWDMYKFKELGVRIRPVLWVVPVTKGVVGDQVYRWVVKGQDYDSFKGARKEIMAAQRAGKFLSLKIHEVSSFNTPAGSIFARIYFLPGSEIEKEQALVKWAAFQKRYQEFKSHPSYAFVKNQPAHQEDQEDEVIVESKPEYLKTPAQKRQEKDEKRKAEADRPVDSDLPWEKLGEEEANPN